MSLISNFDEMYPIEKVFEHADNVVRTNYSSPSAIRQKIFAMSTEMEDGFLKQIDLRMKRILTVGSSGDQIFEYALRGSRDITVMDSNYLTPYFCELKFAALKGLNREEFIKFFNIDNSSFMSKEKYEKVIKPKIQNEIVKKFWDYVFEKDEWYIKCLFQHYKGTSPTYLANDENYNETRLIMDSVSVKFSFADITQFHEHTEGEYDFIDLSNILTYFGKKSEQKFWDAVTDLHKYLSVNGIIKLHYGSLEHPPFNGTFMGKPVRMLNYNDENLSIVVWDNDEEKYSFSHSKTEEFKKK